MSVDTACVWLVCLLYEMKSRVVCVYLRYLIGMVCMMSDVVLLGGHMTSLALSLALSWRVFAEVVYFPSRQ